MFLVYLFFALFFLFHAACYAKKAKFEREFKGHLLAACFACAYSVASLLFEIAR